MGYKALQVKMSYQMMQMLPDHDSTLIKYQEFKEIFGQDGSVMFMGLEDEKAWELSHFQAWYDLCLEIKNIEGIEGILSTSRIFRLVKNDSLKQFDLSQIVQHRPTTQAEVDSLKILITNQKLFEGLLFNSETGVSLMMVTLDKSILNTPKRIPLISEINERVLAFEKDQNCKIFISGLPYIRTETTRMAKGEIIFFTILSILVASLILYFFFRSFRVIIFPMMIVLMSVIWAFGTISIMGYELTILTGVIPSLIVIICVENCIFLLNKFHAEFMKSGDKMVALRETILRIGNANFLTNTTTAAGFAAFIVTGNRTLTEFGIVASISIVFTYIMTLILLPTIFSFLSSPTEKELKHIQRKYVNLIIEKIVYLVETKRKWIFSTAIILSVIGLYGITKLNATGNVVDEVPTDSELYTDLLYLESQFKGVMPFEITIDTKKPKGVMKLSTLKRIERLQDSLRNYPEFSSPLSVVEAVKAGKQAFYGGNPSFYTLPSSNELAFMLKYIPDGFGAGDNNPAKGFVDSTQRITRISVQMANIGTDKIAEIKEELIPIINTIFPKDKYNVTLTGTSLVFLEGTSYLMKNLYQSLGLAVIIICILMAFLFSSARMILVSLIPNILPLIMTAGMMGYVGINIKPSTILIFSVALGISVDNAIHYLSRYRLQLTLNNWKIGKSVILALRETSYSMVYSSVVLFCGFGIFIFSSFGGTKAMGYLIAFTLLIAMLCNILLLPSILLRSKRKITTKTFKEPVASFLDGNELPSNNDKSTL